MYRTLISKVTHVAAGVALAGALFAFQATSAVAASITINDASCTSFTATGSGSITINCIGGGGGPNPPSGCAASANPGSLPVGGGQTTLSVSCTGGGAPTSYSWSALPGVNGLQSSTSTNSQTVSITQTTTFFVVPSNADGAGNQASTAVTVQSGGGGGGGGGGAGFANCTNQGFTVMPAGSVPLTWGSAVEPVSSSAGNFGDGSNTVWVFTLSVPAGTPSSDFSTSYLAVTEFGQGPTLRQVTISSTPCDFRPKSWDGTSGPLAVSNGTTARLLFGVHAPSIFGSSAGLTAGQTYYISVRNWQLDPFPQNSCAGTTCNAKATYQPGI